MNPVTTALRIATVSPTPAAARAAVRRLQNLFPDAELFAATPARFLAAAPATRLFLAPEGKNREEDRRFLEETISRLLWSAPPEDLYGAIAGVLTRLPARPSGGRAESAGGASVRTGLWLEGAVDADRARSALASPARDWIVEHVGAVRLTAQELSALRAEGVRFFSLDPVVLAGVEDATGCARGLFDRGTRVLRRTP